MHSKHSEQKAARKHNVQIIVPPRIDANHPTLILAHGFGCDRQIWEPIAQILSKHFPLVLFDHIGCGKSDLSDYDPQRYVDLNGYADDLLALVAELNLGAPILVGHSVSAAIGWLASLKSPSAFRQIIAIGPSPRYINDPPDYYGGFELSDVEAMIDLMERNHFEWAGYLAPLVMGGEENRPALANQLRQTFLNADPLISRRFAECTFMTDVRIPLSNVRVPSLILYCEEDVIVPVEVISYLQRCIPNCTIRKLNASGHYPHMSHPQEVAKAIIEGVQVVDRN